MNVAQNRILAPLVLQPLTLAEADAQASGAAVPVAEPEEWRRAWGEGDLVYEVSSIGRVRSVKILTVVRDGDRPARVNFYQGNRAVSHYVHDLIAAAFLGKRPDQSVAFRDGDRYNLRPDNLILQDDPPRPSLRQPRPPAVAREAGWLTPAAAAPLMGVSESRVRQLCQAGRLATVPHLTRVLIEPATVEEFLEQRRAGGPVRRPAPVSPAAHVPPAPPAPVAFTPAAPPTPAPTPAPRPPVEPAGPPTPPRLAPVPSGPRLTQRPLVCLPLDGYGRDELDRATLLRDAGGREGWGGHRWYIPGREEGDPADPTSRDHRCTRCDARKPPPETPPLTGNWRSGTNRTIRGLGRAQVDAEVITSDGGSR